MRIGIIGGGFFGCYLARELAVLKHQVFIFEREVNLLTQASLNNQARVHAGYHYPRSLKTARRSQQLSHRFIEEFKPAVTTDTASIYAIPRMHSWTSSQQFAAFCKVIGASCEKAPPHLRQFFDPQLIEEVFLTKELFFDANILRSILSQQLLEKKVVIQTGCAVSKIESTTGKHSLFDSENQKIDSEFDQIYISAYSGINSLLQNSQLPILQIKHELTELALIMPPKNFDNIAITVMDGPFFSFTPIPAHKLHVLSHVLYTPRASNQNLPPIEESIPSNHRVSSANLMIRDASRYLPILSELSAEKSVWQTKAVLAESETSDSRPTMLQAHHGKPGIFVVFGGKIDNIYDAIDYLKTSVWNS